MKKKIGIQWNTQQEVQAYVRQVRKDEIVTRIFQNSHGKLPKRKGVDVRNCQSYEEDQEAE